MKFSQPLRWAAATIVGLAIMPLAPATASQIFVQQSGTSAAGGDPNLITNASAFVIGPDGNQTYVAPTLIIVAEYNGIGTPTVSYSGCAMPTACSLAPVGTYGLTSNNGTATLTAGSGGGNATAFSQLGLNAGGSESFVNFSSADTAIGLAAPTSFSLYAFQIPQVLTAFHTLTIGATAAKGSFILTYACQSSANVAQCANKDLGETVFTNTGLVDPTTTPLSEPASMAMLASGLLGIGFLRWRGARPS